MMGFMFSRKVYRHFQPILGFVSAFLIERDLADKQKAFSTRRDLKTF